MIAIHFRRPIIKERKNIVYIITNYGGNFIHIKITF